VRVHLVHTRDDVPSMESFAEADVRRYDSGYIIDVINLFQMKSIYSQPVVGNLLLCQNGTNTIWWGRFDNWSNNVQKADRVREEQYKFTTFCLGNWATKSSSQVTQVARHLAP